MKSRLVSLILLCVSTTLFAQSPADTLGNIYEELQKKKNKGSVTMDDGKIISGFIEYDFYRDVLYFGTNHKNITRPISPSDARQFEFYDEQLLRDRTFVSVKTPDGMQYFEQLRRRGEHGVLTRTLPTQATSGGSSPRSGIIERKQIFAGVQWKTVDVVPYALQKNAYATVQRMIVGVLFDDEILPFVVYTRKDFDNVGGVGLGWSGQKARRKIVDKKMPQKLCGDKYEAVNNYALQKHLDWTNLDHLLLLFDYYKNL